MFHLKTGTPFAIVVAACLAGLSPASGQSAEPKVNEETTKQKRVLTPEEKAEKAQRRVCKVQICSILSTRDPHGADIDCPIVKTWRKEDITSILSGGRLDWPWGKARCTTQLKLKRSMLVGAAGPDGITAKLEPHRVSCTLDLESDGQTYDVTVDITPEVTFKGGKATAGRMNWGKVDAPMLAYSVLWPGTQLDNSVNILEGTLVEMVNEFMGNKCGEVKDQLPLRASVTLPVN